MSGIIKQKERDVALDRGLRLHEAVSQMLAGLGEHVGGYAFARVVGIYCRASHEGDRQLQHAPCCHHAALLILSALLLYPLVQKWVCLHNSISALYPLIGKKKTIVYGE